MSISDTISAISFVALLWTLLAIATRSEGIPISISGIATGDGESGGIFLVRARLLRHAANLGRTRWLRRYPLEVESE